MCCNICLTGETLLGEEKDTYTELVEWLCASTGLSKVRWTRTTVGGPNDLGGSVTANRSKPQRACWRGTHRTVNSTCSVHHRTIRCAHQQQKQPTTRKWLEAINTPLNHLLQWHPSFLKFTFNTRVIAFTPRHIPKIKSFPSLQINSIH
jgi:hypothetical protein